jgi:hypothetical protein
MVNASPDKATVTSGTTLPSGKTYLPTKSESGGLGAGSDCALALIINIEVRINKMNLLIIMVLISKEN